MRARPAAAADQSDLFERLVRNTGFRGAVQALRILTRAEDRHPSRADWIERLIEADPEKFGNAALMLTTYAENRAPLRRALVRLGVQSPQTFLAAVETAESLLPLPSARRAAFGIELMRQLTVIYRELADRHPDIYSLRLAQSLGRYGAHLASDGRHAEALPVSAESVGLIRALASADGDAREDLVHSLNNHAALLIVTGQEPEALQVSGEAVALSRTIEPQRTELIADSLARHALSHCGNGDYPQGVALAAESIDLYRGLVASDRHSHLKLLANALSNHALLLDDVDHGNALTFSAEGLALARELVEQQGGRHLDALIGRMVDHSNRLQRQRLEGATELAGEAVQLCRAESMENDDERLPLFAKAIDAYCRRLEESGRIIEAVSAYRESAELHRKMVQLDSGRFLPGLAGTLVNYANRLGDSGDHAQASVVSAEAVSLSRGLFAASPDRYCSQLALSLHCHAIQLWHTVRPDEALGVSAEAITLRRALADRKPERYTERLADSLCNHAAFLPRDEVEEAIRVSAEAVTLYQELADAGRLRGVRSLPRALRLHGSLLASAGRRDDGVAAAMEAVARSAELAKRDSGSYDEDLQSSQRGLASLLASDGSAAEAAEVDEFVGLQHPLSDRADLIYVPPLAGSVLADARQPANAWEPDGELASSEEAVQRSRQLCAHDRLPNLPGLADALQNHGAALASRGYLTEALIIFAEAVSLRRELETTEGPSGLAAALEQYCRLLAAAGRGPETLAASEELVRIRVDLVEQDRDLHAAKLVRSLTQHSVFLLGSDRIADALTASLEAVALSRELATAGHQDASALRLANTLAAHASVLTAMNRHSETLEYLREALSICRSLSDGPDSSFRATRLRRIALALEDLAKSSSQTGDWDEAVSCMQEAEHLYRDLAASDPERVPDLARAFGGLASYYAGAGLWREAVEPAEQAVEAYRELTARDVGRKTGLARALINLSSRYAEAGLWYEAVSPAEEAVALRREMSKTDSASLPSLAHALRNLGACYSELGRPADAVRPHEESLTIYARLADWNPRLVPDLALALIALGDNYAHVGRDQEAIACTEEAVRLYRRSADADPTFVPQLAHALSNLGVRYTHSERQLEGLAPAEESVDLYDQAVAGRPALLPDLAEALNNLGILYRELGRKQEAVSTAERSVRLYRTAADASDAFRPYLSNALNSLGSCYSNTGRLTEALERTEEAARIARELVARNPGFLPDLAGALNNLAILYAETGALRAGISATTEAARIYRQIIGQNAGLRAELAAALGNLATFCGMAGEWREGIEPSEEAVRHYRALATAEPALTPQLAERLSQLSMHYRHTDRTDEGIAAAAEAVQLYCEVIGARPDLLAGLAQTLARLSALQEASGKPADATSAWEHAIANMQSPSAASTLLLARARRVEAGHPEAASWLARTLASGDEDRLLTASIHEEARRHRDADPARFDAVWTDQRRQTPPAWLTFDTTTLGIALAWIGTATYVAERDYLAAHPELLDAAADAAVEDALLRLPDQEASRYQAVRNSARIDGVLKAYEPTIQAALAGDFVRASLPDQASMLTAQRDELRSISVAALVQHWRSSEDVAFAHAADRAILLLELARSGDDESFFDALDEGGVMPLLHALAIRPDASSLLPAALMAMGFKSTDVDYSGALFYCAVGEMIAGKEESANTLITRAHSLAPSNSETWTGELAEIGRQHASVVRLIGVLAELESSAAEPASADRAADAHPSATALPRDGRHQLGSV